jgi:hypothetical protein
VKALEIGLFLLIKIALCQKMLNGLLFEFGRMLPRLGMPTKEQPSNTKPSLMNLLRS